MFTMKKYRSFFLIRLKIGLHYRGAVFTTLMTQFLWGLMECIAYKALLETNSVTFPMQYSALVSYIWLKEAFLALFNTWMTDNDLFSMIMDGDIAYELCRPISVYSMWFSRNIGNRIALAAIRGIPIIIVAVVLPKPFHLYLPANGVSLILFLLTIILGLFVTVAFCMLVYILSFFTISPQGLRMVLTGAVNFLAGSIIPIPFIPYPMRTIIELLPFASMQNVPLRIYSGDLSGTNMYTSILLQFFWIILLIGLGKFLYKKAEHRIVIQGG